MRRWGLLALGVFALLALAFVIARVFNDNHLGYIVNLFALGLLAEV